ncbi:MAG TPA: squalene/phytoene synthase family protein [Longimicrobiales bacterium]|nr:squalene/phytoene synthase family protein [Longimicrobiales bacterium]
MSPDFPLRQAERLAPPYASAEAIAARDNNNLYLTSRFFRSPERYKAFCAFYALMRIVDDRIDDIPDRIHLSERSRSREHAVVSAWEASVLSCYEGRRPSRDVVERCGHPDAALLLEAFAESLVAFPAPCRLWVDFFRSMHWDLDHDRFATWQDFLAYAEGASVSPTTIYLFLLASPPRHPSGARPLPAGFDLSTCGRQLGIFAYVGHVVRDIAEDLRMGRRGLLYLTNEDMAAHGVTEDTLRSDLKRERASVATRHLVAELLGRARSFLGRGRASLAPLWGNVDGDCAFIVDLIVTMYERVIDKIERCGFDPLTGQHRLTPTEKGAVVQEVARRVRVEPTTLRGSAQ